MWNDFDLLIVGAGVVGCIVAERAAKLKGWKSLIVDKRSHIAGNCHDTYHESGLLIHKYGPHYFRTNKTEIVDYLSEFTEWVEGNYFVKSYSQGQYFPFPINLDTLEQFYGAKLTPQAASDFLNSIRSHEFPQPKNSEEFVLSRVGRELYEAFYLGYTLKQWERHPRDLDASVCGRIPVRFNRDHRYVDHRFQLTPKDGFTKLFARMIAKPEVKVLLNTDFDEIRHAIKPKRATLYTGPIDQYFAYEYGRLPWRSLEFDFRQYHQEFVQPCVQINYPNDFLYTRTVEIKHVTRQIHPHTVISYEYPKSSGDPYYPVPAPENRALYERYRGLADHEQRTKNVFFAGRLARYTYINTDEAVEMGLATFNDVLKATEIHS
jgi:UDP-galactopyranose mutase